jgi:aminoglycoside/choline kinase family phosphotransferase
MSDFLDRLTEYLETSGTPYNIKQLTPDASTREYFRVERDRTTTIACVYPEPFVAAEHSYLDTTRLFRDCGLPVAEIIDFDESLGVIIIEDLGDTILRDVLVSSSNDQRELYLDRAIGLIAQIQAATDAAVASGSIASALRFDVEKLSWELEFFREHYFSTYRARPLSVEDDADVRSEFIELARDLESRIVVLCHRDFHAANLMIDGSGKLRIIDHQDARMGTASYDLVSLLLDRVTEPPTAAWLAEKRRFFLSQRDANGLARLDENEFAEEFRLQTIQRCLKAVGTFSFQSATRGKTYFEPFILPMFQIVQRALVQVQRFPVLEKLVAREIELFGTGSP